MTRAVVMAVALAACAGTQDVRARPAPEPRVRTAGTDLHALLPAGTAGLLEVDVARVRRNPVLGPVLAALAGREQVTLHGVDVLRDADLVAAAFLRPGLAGAETYVFVRGEAIDARAIAAARDDVTAIDAHTLGPAGLPAHQRGLHQDAAFQRLRDEAMPARAPGASVRLTARLAFDERVAISGRLAIDEVPATISLWLDVADDLGMIALLGADDAAASGRLVDAVVATRARELARAPRELGLGRLFGSLRAERAGKTAKVTWVVGPRGLAAWSERMLALLGAGDAS